jgi:DNA-binding MarR family transcriptional regulator
MIKSQFTEGELYRFITGMASTALARRLQKNFKQKHVEITIEQWSVLYHLWNNDGVSQQELCEQSFKDKPSITRLVDNLEKLKLVKRVPCKEDKRRNLIYLTNKGHDLQDETMELANQTLNEALVGVSKKEIDVCKSVLQRVHENLKTDGCRHSSDTEA